MKEIRRTKNRENKNKTGHLCTAALMRYDQRAQGVEAQNQIEKWVDTHFDDARMKQIYPKAKSTH